MILAAGLGTRLRPLTYQTPKALVEVGDEPVLEKVARRVVEAGADRIVVNVSPHADQIRAYIERRDGWGREVHVSEEPDGPLETGGGLLKAAPLFRRDRPILIHNADILTDVDLESLYRTHERQGDSVLATLATRAAESDRYLIFDEEGMVGFAYGGKENRARESHGEERHRDYLGVSVIEPRLLDLFEETGKFSIFTPLMRLIRSGERVTEYAADQARWSDIGTHEQLEEARQLWG